MNGKMTLQMQETLVFQRQKRLDFFIDSDEIMSKGCLEQLNASINEAMAYSENNEKLVFRLKQLIRMILYSTMQEEYLLMMETLNTKGVYTNILS